MTVQEQEPQEEPAAPAPKPKLSRRAWVMRGLVTPVLGLLAVACIGLGVLNATVWKPSSEITADVSVKGTRYIVTDPGVLPLVDEQVDLTVTSSDTSGEACVALGSGKDINGWLAGSSYTRIVGLADWSSLATEQTTAQSDTQSDATNQSDGQSGSTDGQSDPSAQPTDEVAFKDSDMWTSVTCGTGTVSLSEKISGSSVMALVDLGENADTATVSMHWTRHVLPDFAMPFYFAGGLLIVLAVLTASVFAMPPHKRRKRVVESVPVVEEVTVGAALAGSLAKFKPVVPSRRPKRGRRRHASPKDAATGTQPVIVDPAARNLVADQAQAADQETAASASTAAITPTDESHDAAVPSLPALNIPTLTDGPGTSSTPGTSATPLSDSPAEPRESAPAPAEAPRSDETSVITPDELQAYFARLAQEVGMDGTNEEGE